MLSVRLITHSCYFATAALQGVIRFRLLDQQSGHFQTLHGNKEDAVHFNLQSISSSLILDVVIGQSDLNLSGPQYMQKPETQALL